MFDFLWDLQGWQMVGVVWGIYVVGTLVAESLLDR